jgi:ribosomal protein L9
METMTEMKEPEMGLTFEKVWAALLKSGEEFDRRMQETDRRMQKLGEETDLQMKETARQMKETARQMKETDKKLGELGRKFGSVVEHMVAPNLVEKFNALGFNFQCQQVKRKQWSNIMK